MTPQDTSKEAIEAEARMMDRSKNHIWAKKVRALAAERDALAAQLAEARAEIASLQSGAVKVKPLEWKRIADFYLVANTERHGSFSISHFEDGKVDLYCPDAISRMRFSSIREAKDVAQKWHNRRILADIETTSADEVFNEAIEATVEAVLKVDAASIMPTQVQAYCLYAIRQLKRVEG